ncbi:MAG TPA: VOC family protein [Bdellovibrionales bacterium]|jgi:catechol 2,3-dioxygenase-like lactoylglutathione lyase family enzyme|nr:VOC family protein [Bdellovibrionales bacterium]
MAVQRLGVTVLWTNQLQKMRAFYSTAGLILEEEVHGDGPLHYTADVAGVHFAIYEETKKGSSSVQLRGQSGFTHIGFVVDDVEESFARLKELGAPIGWEIQSKPWGKAAMFFDPDGRSVEIFEG